MKTLGLRDLGAYWWITSSPSKWKVICM